MATIVNKQDPRAEQWSSALRSFGKSYAEQSHLSQSLAQRAKDRAMQMLALNLQEARYAEGAESRRLQKEQLKQQLDQASTRVEALDAFNRLRDNHYGVANFSLQPTWPDRNTPMYGLQRSRRWQKGTPTSDLKKDLKAVRLNHEVYAQYTQAQPGWKRTQDQTLARLQGIELAPPDSALRRAIETRYGAWDDLDGDNKIAIAGALGNDIIKLLTAYMSGTGKSFTAVEQKHSEKYFGAIASLPYLATDVTRELGRPDPTNTNQVAFYQRAAMVEKQIPRDPQGNPLPYGSLESLNMYDDVDAFAALSLGDRSKELNRMIDGELISFQYSNGIFIAPGGHRNIIRLRLNKIIEGLNDKLKYNADNPEATKDLTEYEKLMQAIINTDSSTAVVIGETTEAPANKVLFAMLLQDSKGWHKNAKDILTGKKVTPTEAAAAINRSLSATTRKEEIAEEAVGDTPETPDATEEPNRRTSYTTEQFQGLTLSEGSILEMANNSLGQTGVEIGTRGGSTGLIGHNIPDDIRYTKNEEGTRIERSASNFIRDTYYTGSGEGETAFSKKIHGILGEDAKDDASRIRAALETTENHIFEAHVHDRVSNQFIKPLVDLYGEERATIFLNAIVGGQGQQKGILHDLAANKDSDRGQEYLRFKGRVTIPTREILENLERIYSLVGKNYKHFKFDQDPAKNKATGLLSRAIIHYMGS